MESKKAQKRQFFVVLMIVFLGFFFISMPYLIFPALFLNPVYSILSPETSSLTRSLLLGVTLAAYPLGQFIGSPILGALSDDYGRKGIMFTSLLVTSLASLFSGFAIRFEHLSLLIFSRFIAGLMEGNIAIARAIAADLKGLPKHQTFGKINATTATAYLIGPLVGGLFFCIAILSSLVLHKSLPSKKKERTFKERVHFPRRMKGLFANPQLKSLILTSTFFTLAVDIFYEFGPVFLTVQWMYAPSQLIFYSAILCLGLMAGNGWLPTFVSQRTVQRWPIFGAMFAFALLVAGIVGIAIPSAIILLFFLSGLVIGLAVTLLTVKISDAASDRIQGEVMGVQVSLRVLGDAIICLFGGVLLILSSQLILLFASLLSLFALVYYFLKGPSQ